MLVCWRTAPTGLAHVVVVLDLVGRRVGEHVVFRDLDVAPAFAERSLIDQDLV